MASYSELVIDYGVAYAIWAFLEYHCDGWLERFAQKQMNRISRQRYGKNVFFLSGEDR